MVSRSAKWMQGSACACTSLLLAATAAHAADAGSNSPTQVSVPSPAETARASASLPQPFDARESTKPHDDGSVFESPWLWVGVAGVVAGGIVAGVLLAHSSSEPSVPKGTLKLTVSVLTKEP